MFEPEPPNEFTVTCPLFGIQVKGETVIVADKATAGCVTITVAVPVHCVISSLTIIVYVLATTFAKDITGAF